MINKSRRKFFKYLSLAAGIVLLPGCGEVEISANTLKNKVIPLNHFDGVTVLFNLIKTNDSFKDKLTLTSSSPAFKQLKAKLLNLTEDEILTKIESDFENDKTFDVKGYVFSNTELALYEIYFPINVVN